MGCNSISATSMHKKLNKQIQHVCDHGEKKRLDCIGKGAHGSGAV